MLTPRELELAAEHAREFERKLGKLDPGHKDAGELVGRLYAKHLGDGKCLVDAKGLDRLVELSETGTDNRLDHRNQFEYELHRLLGTHLIPDHSRKLYLTLAEHWISSRNIIELMHSLHEQRENIPNVRGIERAEILSALGDHTGAKSRAIIILGKIEEACRGFSIDMPKGWKAGFEEYGRKLTPSAAKDLPLDGIATTAGRLTDRVQEQRDTLMSPPAALVHRVNLYVLHGIGTKRILERWR